MLTEWWAPKTSWVLQVPWEMMLVVLVLDSDVNQLISSSKDIDMFSLPLETSFSTFSAYIGTVLPYNFVLRRARRGCTSPMVGRATRDLSMHLAAKLRRSRKISSESDIAACRRAEVLLEVLAFSRRDENWKWRNRRGGNSTRAIRRVRGGRGIEISLCK